MKRLVIIDGNAVLHRAYHALPPLTTPDGTLVNAVYGFASMILKIFSDLTPSHMAVAFDRAAPTFRKEMFEGYQAKRPKMDDELVSQIGLVHDLVASFGLPVFEMDGFEADDVIGTIVDKAINLKTEDKNNIDQVIIVTGDRDILQLVTDERVFVYMPTKGLSEARLYSEKEVLERMGVKPDLIPDLKALAGDSSDNYPGVDGIGPKTAVNLINQFGSVTDLYRALGKPGNAIPSGIAGKLKAGEKSAELSHQLATIRKDIPIKVDLDLARIETLNTAQSRDILRRLHFPSLLTRLTGEKQVKAVGKIPKTELKKNSEDKAEQLSLV